jgi:WD40 repeat protein
VAGAELSAADAARGLLLGSFPGAARPSEETPPPATSGVLSSSAIHLPGQDESSHLSESGRPYWQSVARIGAQVADALAYAHSQGVLHRDVKPANLMLDTQGTVWVTDFGLAKVAADEDHLTETGDVIGTVRYMAPEAFAGPGDARGDVYGLGLTLYELLTLRPAFEEKDRRRLLDNIMDGTLSPPRKVNPAVPRDLETVVLKAIARDPAQRYATAADLAEDLRRFLADRPIRARRVSLREQVWRWCRRNPALALLSASVALLVVTVAIVSSVAAVWLGHERGKALEHQKEAEAAKQDALDKLWGSDLAQAQARRWSGQPGRHFRSLEALRDAAALRTSLELRNEAVACIPLVDLRVERQWKGRLGWPESYGIAFDAKLERYARAEADGLVSVRAAAADVEFLRLPRISPKAQSPTWLLFSSDGQLLAAVYAEYGAVVWDLSRGKVVVNIPAPPGSKSVGLPKFSPDGRRVLVTLGQGWLACYDLATGLEVKRFAIGAGPAAARWSPEGERIACRYDETPLLVEIRDANTGKVLRELKHPEGANAFAWHPDGRLLTASSHKEICIWDTHTGKQRAVLEGHQSDVRGLAFSHAGDLLASHAWDGTTRLWDWMSGKELVSIPGSFSSFRSDDRYLAFASGEDVGLWEVAAGRQCRTLYTFGEKDEGPWTVDVHPNGRLAATSHDDGARLWDLAAGKVVAHLPVGWNRTARFGPAGDWLITGTNHRIHRWPITADPQGGTLVVGPPQTLGEPLLREHPSAELSRDGRCLVIPNGPADVIVLDLEHPGKKVLVDGHALGPMNVPVSPDGRWVVTQSQAGSGIKVWDIRAGVVVKEFPGVYDWATFSPDGKWLVTGSHQHATCLWEVGSWQVRHSWHTDRAYGHPTLSPDGKLLAVKHTSLNKLIDLLDPETGQVLATLPAPNPLPISELRFTPDGGRLVAGCYNYRALQVWDLTAIRARLREMNLDWEPPAAAPAQPEAVPPLQVAVLSGDLQAPGGK